MNSVATAPVRDEEITAFFAADPETIAWPYPMYERWRAGSGVVRWEGGPATRGGRVVAAATERLLEAALTLLDCRAAG